MDEAAEWVCMGARVQALHRRYGWYVNTLFNVNRLFNNEQALHRRYVWYVNNLFNVNRLFNNEQALHYTFYSPFTHLQ